MFPGDVDTAGLGTTLKTTFLEHLSASALLKFSQFPWWLRGKESPLQCRRPGFDLGQEDPLVEEMATHSSTLAWRILWTEKPDRLQSIGSQRIRHNYSNLAAGAAYLKDRLWSIPSVGSSVV